MRTEKQKIASKKWSEQMLFRKRVKKIKESTEIMGFKFIENKFCKPDLVCVVRDNKIIKSFLVRGEVE